MPPWRLAGVDGARDIASATRLLVGLPVFLRRRPVAQEAHAVIRRRLERRSATFLELARQAIFARPANPYHRLLRPAGCELGDLAHLVQRDGLEGALRALFRAGVYLRTDEAKGRQPVVRGGQSFRNPSLGASEPSAGEPLPDAHRRKQRRAGLHSHCLDEGAVNEVHLLSDLNAVVQPGNADGGPSLPSRALLLTTISPTAPMVALNLSLGDQARLDQRDCGCPYQQTGWTTHLTDIESFEKLNAGGTDVPGHGHRPSPRAGSAGPLRRGADGLSARRA